MNLNTSKTPQRNTKRKWGIIMLSSIIIISVIGYLNKDWLYSGYYYVFKYDHFEKGDAVYISPDYFKDTNSNGVELLRLIRPLNNSEVDQLPSLSNDEKTLIKLSLINSKTYLIAPHIDILKKYLVANKTYKIGTYVKKDMVHIPMIDGNGKPVIILGLFYAILPDKQVIYTDPNPYLKDMPKYYTWANNTLYVFPSDISNKGK